MNKLRNVGGFKGWSKERTYLLLINPESIPHLVFVHKGKYYSLTYFGTEVREDFTTYFHQLKRLNKKLIFIDLKYSKNTEETYEVFKKYTRAGEEEKSCFAPVKELLLPNSKAEMVFQLIPELYENQLINSVSQLGLEKTVDNSGNFELTTYNKEDIFSYIQLLKEKHDKRQKSQSKSC